MATAAAVPAPAPQAPDPVFLMVPRRNVRPSPLNHRRIFDPKELEQLAASIKSKGIISPLTVRPKPNDNPKAAKAERDLVAFGLLSSPATYKPDDSYELVCGERRWRAAEIAGLAFLPCLVRELSDQEVLEVQLIENLQRTDVHPIEEANGFNDLMKKHGYSAERIAEKTGKSKGYVYARLKLCALVPEARDACLEGKIAPEVALRIARVPTKDGLQAKALKMILQGKPEHSDFAVGLDAPREGLSATPEDGRARRVAYSVREATELLQRNFMLRLELAPFSLDDKDLVPSAGPCTGCLKRTGNQRELFSDVKSADVCTDPACYDDKKEHLWLRRVARAREAKEVVLSPTESKKLFWDDGNRFGVVSNSGYIELDQAENYDVDSTGKKTWKQLLGKLRPPIVLARDPAGVAREVYERSAALELLGKTDKKEAKEVKSALQGIGKYKPTPKEEAAAKKERDRIELRRRTVKLALARIGDKAEAGIAEKKLNAMWTWMVGILAEVFDASIGDALERRIGQEKTEELTFSDDAAKAARKLGTAVCRGIVVEVLASFDANRWDDKTPEFDTALELFGVDRKKCEADAKAALKAEADAAEVESAIAGLEESGELDLKKPAAKKGAKKS